MAWCLTLIGVAALANPIEPRPQDQPAPKRPADTFVKCLWAVSDVVLEQHIDPPARQEMMRAGIKSLLQKAGVTLPADLSRRISTLTTEEDFAVLLQECWPKAGVKAPAAEELTTAMLQGLLQRVPGEPDLLPPKELKVIEQIRDNRYVGIGIQLSMNPKENRGQIVDPFRGGPARKAGARPGDLILEVDGKNTEEMKLTALVDLIRGEEGTPVTLVVRQPGATETRTLKMTRGVVPFQTVLGLKRGADDAWVYRVHPEAPVAYLQITSITSSNLHELRQAEQQLQAAGFRALVLDLRQTSGDAIQHAALLADGLLDGGVLWHVRDARQRVKEYRADRDCLFRDWPLAVLVDDSTGAAAGWVAQALRNNRRAILVGDTVKENRYVKTLIPLPGDLGAIELRTGVVEWPSSPPSTKAAQDETTPAGRKPEHAVRMNPQQREALRQWFFAKTKSELPAKVSHDPPEDPQLAKAVELMQEVLRKTGRKEKSEEPGRSRQ
jgi:carboxyl-terminal processing protease